VGHLFVDEQETTEPNSQAHQLPRV